METVQSLDWPTKAFPFDQVLRTIAMGKTLLRSKKTEWKGLDRIAGIVHEMGCIWRETTKDDFGIDGEVEVVAPKPDGKAGFEVTGGIVKVQSKSGKSYVVEDREDSFSSPVNEDDLKYWQRCNFPVLYIVYHPEDDCLYFKEVKEYLQSSETAFKRPYRIRFNKATDVFGPQAQGDVWRHASVSPPRISFEQKERLFSNLLRIKTLPKHVYFAKTRKRSWQAVREDTKGFVPPGCISGGKLYSLSDLSAENNNLRQWCVGEADRVAAEDWIEDEDQRSDFVYMLNQLLGKHLHHCGVRFNKDFRRNYFPRENDETLVFERTWTSVRSDMTDERIVVKYYEYGRDQFWRHLASDIGFEQFGDDWFLQIIPMYFFTTDGETPCSGELAGPYTTSLKADEHNLQVLNHVLFWSDVLSKQRSEIVMQLDWQPILRIEKMPVRWIAPFAIPDDPATYEEKAHPRQAVLFGEDEDDRD